MKWKKIIVQELKKKKILVYVLVKQIKERS